MTYKERVERMLSCAHNQPVGVLCQLGGYPPLDCGFCENYINAEKEAGDDMNDIGGVKIYVPANKLWDFYVQNKKRCKEEMVLIAENTETGYAIYVTEDDGSPMLSVCKDDEKPEIEEWVLDTADCEATAKKLLTRYLIPFTVIEGGALAGDAPSSWQDAEDEMYEREDALDFAIQDFLAVVLQKEDGHEVAAEYGEGFMQEVLHHILEYLTDEHGIKVFRPMLFTEDDGSEVYTDFPYEEYTFSSNRSEKRDPLPG